MPREATPQRKETLWSLIQRFDVQMASAFTLLGGTALSALEPTLPNYMEQEFDSSSLIIGLVFMCESVIYGLFSPVVGYLGDKIKSTRHFTMIVGTIALGGMMPLIGLTTAEWQVFLVTVGSGIAVAVALTPTLPILGGTHLSPSIRYSSESSPFTRCGRILGWRRVWPGVCNIQHHVFRRNDARSLCGWRPC